MTLKLYYSTGTCSLASHILLRESGLEFDLEAVDLTKHETSDKLDFYTINDKGYVPVLELSDGRRLTEGPVIAQYIGDVAGDRQLMPEAGSFERYQVMAWQNYITSELHKFFWPLFHLGNEYKQPFKEALLKKFSLINSHLENHQYLGNNSFTAADAYLFTVSRWTNMVGIDISDLKALQKYLARIEERPAVKDALKAEGLS